MALRPPVSGPSPLIPNIVLDGVIPQGEAVSVISETTALGTMAVPRRG